jgi:beta-glucanase (GH16 family)
LTAQAGGDNKEFSRGCYEIRAKFPDAPGSFPAFWLISAFGPEWTDASGAKNRPEIDVVETIGEPNRFYTTGHNFGPANNRLDRTTYHPVDRAVSGAFHTYSVRWSDSAVICYFDGQEVFRESARTPQTSSIYHHLNFALGDTGHWAGPVDDTYFETSPKLEVDYVLVTQ